MTRKLTGRHVLIIVLAAFGIVVAANMAMLLAATGTFPGLVVRNSYVESQGWNDRVAAQTALEWVPEIVYADRRLAVSLRDRDGSAVANLSLEATVGRPASDADDRTLALIAGPDGHVAPLDLGPGVWRIELRTVSGPAWRAVATVDVAGQR